MNKFLKQLNILLSNRVVTFNGENYPKFGWCLIIVGGPASGKSTYLNKAILLDGKEFNIDKISETWQENYNKLLERVRPLCKKYILKIFNNKPPNLSNQDDVSKLHQLATGTLNKYEENNPLSKNVFDRSKEYFYNTKEIFEDLNTLQNKFQKSLPNVIYDITGRQFFNDGNVKDNLKLLKNMGYKTSIVWILTDIEKAVFYNQGRDRTVPTSFLIQTHNDVYNNLKKLLTEIDDEKDITNMKNLDEFWILFTSTTDKNIKERTYKVKKEGSYFKIDNEILEKISNESGIDKIDKIIDKKGKYDIKIIKNNTETIISITKNKKGLYIEENITDPNIINHIKFDEIINVKPKEVKKRKLPG